MLPRAPCFSKTVRVNLGLPRYEDCIDAAGILQSVQIRIERARITVEIFAFTAPTLEASDAMHQEIVEIEEDLSLLVFFGSGGPSGADV